MHHRDRGGFARVKREHGDWIVRTWLKRNGGEHGNAEGALPGLDSNERKILPLAIVRIAALGIEDRDGAERVEARAALRLGATCAKHMPSSDDPRLPPKDHDECTAAEVDRIFRCSARSGEHRSSSVADLVEVLPARSRDAPMAVPQSLPAAAETGPPRHHAHEANSSR